MENDFREYDPAPADCFQLEELKILQSFDNQLLVDANYYLWLNHTGGSNAPLRFLYSLELVFESAGPLLLSSGEDSEAIRLIGVEDLLETARRLQHMHGKALIQRVSAGAQPMWRESVGKTLKGIRLSRNEAGLFLNDALLLDFGERHILVRLHEREGLIVVSREL